MCIVQSLFHLALLSSYLCYLLLRIIVAVSHCEFRRREKENKRCDRAEESAAILPAIAELLRFRLVALTRLHQLSSHVYSSSVAAFKALFVLRTKDQLDTLCRFPLLSPLHYMPHQFLIDRSTSIFHVMPGRNRGLSTGKKGKIPLLFFLIVNVVVNEKKGTTLEMYSPLIFFCAEGRSIGVFFYMTHMTMLANYQRRHPLGSAMRAGYCLVFNRRQTNKYLFTQLPLRVRTFRQFHRH